jgi:hypothetical protein
VSLPSAAFRYLICPCQALRSYARTFLYAGRAGGSLDEAVQATKIAQRSRHGYGRSDLSVTGGPPLLFGVSRDLSRADDVDEPRHRDEIDHRSNDHRKQPGGSYLPPSTHHSPLSSRGAASLSALLVGEKQGAHRALVTMP